MKMTIARLKKSTIAKKIIVGILTLNVALFSTIPVYAVAENTEYENSLRSGWGSTYTNWSAPSGYGNSWNAQVLRFFTEFNTRIKNIYDTLGTTNSVLGDIKTRTGYIPTINDNILKLYTGWGSFPNWSQPSSMGSSWYAWVQKALYQYKSDLTDIVSNTSYLSNYEGYLSQITTNSGITVDNTSGINIKAGSILDQFAVGNHTFKVLSFSNTQYTPDNANRSINIVDNSPSAMGYIGYRASNTGGYGLYTSTVNTMGNRLSIMNNNLLQIFTALYSANTFYRFGVPNYSTGTITGLRAYSIMDSISGLQHQASQFFARMGFVLADDDTISAKNANKAQEQVVLTNFTGQGNASASASDFGELSSAVSSVKSGLNTNASPSDVLTVFNSTDGFGWFSQATLDELDTTSQNTRMMKGGSNTPLYDSNYNAIMEYLTGGEKK